MVSRGHLLENGFSTININMLKVEEVELESLWECEKGAGLKEETIS